MKQSPPSGPAELLEHLCVPADALAKLEIYAALLARWQKKINLVGPSTIDDVWRRHFLDSAQLLAHLPETATRPADIGSGAGFPGLVLAILDATPDRQIHLIESDARKAAVRGEVNRETGAGAIIVNERAEALTDLGADLVTARAVAPLTRLLPWVDAVSAAGATALLMKGKQWRD